MNLLNFPLDTTSLLMEGPDKMLAIVKNLHHD